MRKLISLTFLALFTSGCMNPAAISRSVKNLGQRITPTARKIETGSRRLVSAAGQAADDATLGARVRAVLVTRKEIDPRHIRVAVEDGTVVLTGRVATSRSRRLVGEAAAETIGVTRVVNRLKVVAGR